MKNEKKLNLNLDPKDAEDLYCKHCAKERPDEDLHNIFIQAFILKKFPGIKVGSPKPVIMPLPAFFICSQCGNIIKLNEEEDVENSSNIIK